MGEVEAEGEVGGLFGLRVCSLQSSKIRVAVDLGNISLQKRLRLWRACAEEPGVWSAVMYVV